MLFEKVDYMADKINGNILEVEGAGICYTRGGTINFYEKTASPNVRRGIENGEINGYRWLVGRQLKAPQLGYCQFGKKAEYVSRVPARIWKVGLSKNNCMNDILNKYNIDDVAKALVRLKHREYPNWEETRRLVRGGYNSVAFSKRYCYTNRNNVMFMGNPMGRVQNGEFLFDTQDELDFHRDNIASLGVDLPMKVVPRKKAKILNPEIEDV